MEWTPEVIAAEVERRHEAARHSKLVRAVREARGERPHWWQRLRSHRDPEDQGEAEAA